MARHTRARHSIKLFGEDYRVTIKSERRHGERSMKGRFYVHGEPNPEVVYDDIAERPPYGARGENEANDKAWDIYNKREIQIAREVVEVALKAAGIEVPKMGFSRYAGCSSCACSPGFVIKDPGHEFHGYDVWVSVLPLEEGLAKEREEALREAARVPPEVREEVKSKVSSLAIDAKYLASDLAEHADKSVAKIIALEAELAALRLKLQPYADKHAALTPPKAEEAIA